MDIQMPNWLPYSNIGPLHVVYTEISVFVSAFAFFKDVTYRDVLKIFL